MFALLWALPAAEAQEFEHTRILNELQPVVIEDASPIPSGFQADSAVVARPNAEEEELAVRPALRYGFGDRLSASLVTELAVDGRQGEFGGVDLVGHWHIFRQRGILPDVAFVAEVGSPSADADAGVGGGVLLTATADRFRLHGNGRYRAQFGAPDEWLAGGAMDFVFGQRVLLIGDGYVRSFEDDVFPGADLGLSIRAGRSFRIQGAAGVLAPDEGLGTQFLVGISSHG